MTVADLHRLRRTWDKLGRANPMWAVCTRTDDRHRDAEHFFASGVAEAERVMTRLDALAPGLERGAVLDFGCGVGRVTQALRTYFAEAVGVDVAPSMVEAAQCFDVSGTCTFVVNDGPDLARRADASFDLVFSTMVFQHMAPALTAGYLREFQRVLRPSGALLFTMTTQPSATWRGRLWRVVPRPVMNAYKRWHDGYGAAMEMHGIPEDEMSALLAAAGFAVIARHPSPVALPDWHATEYLARPG
jgi:ubiquinone/menaquinone biosynthesis C-methylase UbiE